ncbi:MAG TPA: ATP-binding protein [Xanthobacteraceae bacterium]|nr:ATP-binding protein [Xanthobacteraceae bacterium]
MPEAIRAESGLERADPRCATLPSLVISAALSLSAGEARAAGLSPDLGGFLSGLYALDAQGIAALAMTLGAVAFAVLSAVLLVRMRARWAQAVAAARAEAAALRAEVDQAAALLSAEPQVLVIWPAGDDEPRIVGDTQIVTSVPIPRRTLAFGTWLRPDLAQAMESAVASLRERGEAFSMPLTTLGGHHLEAEGKAIGGRAVLRLRDVSGARRALNELAAAHRKLLAEIEPFRRLIETLPAPVWARAADGRLRWVNAAYAVAVEAADAADAVARQLELLERPAREEADRARGQGEAYSRRMPVIVAGNRCVVDVFEAPAESGSAGVGIDVTEAESLRVELARMLEAHRRTLDQLPSAVAIFTANHRLAFCNAAYRTLWELDPAFLDQEPTDSAILDRLRAQRKLPEQADFREWRNRLFEAYHGLESKEHWWHLPDGRTLRVVTTPNPEGGITYVFDDVTEKLELERRYDALIRVQGETLDNLAEAVAVFGSDGRLRLFNPAFSTMWRIPSALLANRPHIENVVELCRPLHADADFWDRLRAAVTSLEARLPVEGRLERGDGSVIDCATLPLPDGATLVTFQDVTDTVNFERALRERNDALEAADVLKNDFIHHVSYELRTPLTNIIGFAHLLHDDATGPLTEKQREYLGYISSSSAALLAIINDILDLASIDAGAMQLDLGPVDIRRTMEAAAEGVLDRLAEHDLSLNIHTPHDLGSFIADERRVRQILFNLLSNAIAFSSPGGTITLTAERRADSILLSVMDNGRGIPAEIADRVFDRFETHSLGSQHRGAGLGLSIVRSFVELHGGTVSLHSVEGQGTTVTCEFPIDHTARRVAAE